MRLSAILQLLAVLGASEVNAFFRMNCGIIQTGRVDPIVSPNQAAGHVHKISGSSNININSTADTLLASSCTSCQIQADKSAYWTPGFYFAHADGTFEEVPNAGMTIYYLDRGEDDGNEMKAFPKGLQMLSGNQGARTFDANKLTVPGGRPIAERVNFACINDANPAPETYGITNLDCPQGFRAQVHFQSCWDGERTSSSDQSHVAYLSHIDNGVCPPTHPILLPHLFYEVNYSMDKIDTSKGGTYMFANGDTTGYGFHGDFMNGWDQDLLTKAVDECIVGDVLKSGVIDDCAPLSASNSADAARRCTERSPVFPCEPVHGVLKTLPGCTGSASSLTCSSSNQPTCAATYNTLGLSASTGTDKFSLLGCYTESNSGRALTAETTTDATDMTVEKCLDFCAGFEYAGVEYGQECYCGNTLAADSTLTTADLCDMACKGNEYQTCGAERLLNMYQAKNSGNSSSSSVPSTSSTNSRTSTSSIASSSSSSTTSEPPSSSSTFATSTRTSSTTESLIATPSATGALSNYIPMGCYYEVSGRLLNSASTSTDQMTPQLCAAYCLSENLPLFGLEYGRECWCGTYFRGGAKAAPSADCSTPCAGDKTSKCGAGDRLSVYSTLDWVAPSIPSTVAVSNTTLSYTYAGCFTDANAAPNPYRALSAKITTDFSEMTVDMCAAFCKDYKTFGVEYSGECYCGNALAAGSIQKADSECGLTCPGNYKQLACGDAARLSVFERS